LVKLDNDICKAKTGKHQFLLQCISAATQLSVNQLNELYY